MYFGGLVVDEVGRRKCSSWWLVGLRLAPVALYARRFGAYPSFCCLARVGPLAGLGNGHAAGASILWPTVGSVNCTTLEGRVVWIGPRSKNNIFNDFHQQIGHFNFFTMPKMAAPNWLQKRKILHLINTLASRLS